MRTRGISKNPGMQHPRIWDQWDDSQEICGQERYGGSKGGPYGECLKKLEGKQAIVRAGFERCFDLVYFHEDQRSMYTRERCEVADHEIELCGYFVLITSKKMTAKEALALYKGWVESEKLFRGDKSYLGNKSDRAYSEELANAKILMEFVALIIIKMYTSLKDEMIRNEKKDN